MTSALAYGFMQRALLATLMVASLCSLVGFFVVLKRLSFVSVGLSHAAFGGVAIGLLLGTNPVLTAGVFAVAVAIAIGVVSRGTRVPEDTVIGVFYSCSMALGVILVGLSRSYQADLFGYLFGNVLAVTPGDLKAVAVVGGIVTAYLALFFKETLAICFDEEMARVQGLPVCLVYYGLLVCVAATVMVCVRVVGIVLASALLVIPAATGLACSSDYRWALAISLTTGVLSGLLGLGFSYSLDLASGASIVLCAGAAFLLVNTRGLVRRLLSRHSQCKQPHDSV